MKKHRMQLWITALLVIAMLIPTAIAGADDAAETVAKATSIELLKGTTNLAQQTLGWTAQSGKSLDLTVNMVNKSKPNATVTEEFTCSSSNTSVATCTITGADNSTTQTTGKTGDSIKIALPAEPSTGTATITVKGAKYGRYARITIKVGDMATGVELEMAKDSSGAEYPSEITAGGSTQLTWTVSYGDDTGKAVKDKNAKFTVYDSAGKVYKSVTVSSRGKVTAYSSISDKVDVTIVACSSDNARIADGVSPVCSDPVKVSITPRVKSLDICMDEAGKNCPASISVDIDATTLPTLNAYVLPASIADTDVKWKSNNTNVVDVDEDAGTLEIKDEGSATITATAQDDSKKSSSIKITVSELAEEVTLTAAEGFENKLTSGKSTKYTAEVTEPEDSKVKITWKVIDTSCKAFEEDEPSTLSSCPASNYATVSSGTVRAKTVTGPQEVTVVACSADGGDCASDPITIVPAVTKISLTADYNDEANVEVISSKTIAIEKTDTDGITFTAAIEPSTADQTVTWKVSSNSLELGSDCKENGETCTVTPASSPNTGTTYTVTATAGKKSATARVSIVDALVTDVEIKWNNAGVKPDGDTLTLSNGQTSTFIANITPEKAKKNVKWSVVTCEGGKPTDQDDLAACKKSSVATVSNGKITARRTSSITKLYLIAEAADGSGVLDAYPVTVNPAVTGITLWYTPDTADSTKTNVTGKTIKTSFDMRTDEEQYVQLDYKISPEAAKDSANLKWTSNNEGIAGVDQNGKVTFYNSGTVTITATAQDGSKKSAKVTIKSQILVSKITISGPTTVGAGKSIQLKADIKPSTAQNKTLKWTSSNPAVVKVDKNSGRVTGVSSVRNPLTVTITATATDVDTRYQTPASETYEVTVYPAVTEVNITDEDSNVSLNKTTIGLDLSEGSCEKGKGCKTYQLDAYTLPDSASDEVTWTSSNTNVATVDEDGLVTAVGNGTCNIVCAAADGSGKNAYVTINVNKMVSEIEIEKPTETDDEGNKYYLVRSGQTIDVYADIREYAPANANLNWVVENTDVVTVAGAWSYNETTKNADGNTVNTTTGKVTLRGVYNLTADKVTDTCTTIYAEAKDGSGITSNPVKVCVRPLVRNIVIMDKDDTTTDAGETIEVPVNGSVTVTAYGDPEGSEQKFEFTSGDTNHVWFGNDKQKTVTATEATLIVCHEKDKVVTIYVKATDGSNTQTWFKIKTVEAPKEDNDKSSASALSFMGINLLSGSGDASNEASISAASLDLDDTGGTANAANADPYTLSAGDVAQLLVESSAEEDADKKIYCYSRNEDLITVVEPDLCVIRVADEIPEDTTVMLDAMVIGGSESLAGREIKLVKSSFTDPSAGTDTDAAAVDNTDTTTTESTDVTVTETETEAPSETVTETEVPSETVTETVTETAAETVSTPESTPETEEQNIALISEQQPVDSGNAVTAINLALDTEKIEVTAGQTVTIAGDKLTVEPAEADKSALTYTSADEAIAKVSVDANGINIEGVAAGETTLTIASGEVTKSVAIVVKAPEAPAVTAIKLDDVQNDAVELDEGTSKTLDETNKLAIEPADADWNTLEFKFEPEGVAKLHSGNIDEIRANGLIIDALAEGTTTLTIKSGDVEKKITITVKKVVPTETATPDPVITTEEPSPVVTTEEPTQESTPETTPESGNTGEGESEGEGKTDVTEINGLDDATLS